MKNFYNKLTIILPLISLHYLCVPNVSNAQCCAAVGCSYNDRISIEYPYRLKGVQSDSCGCQGFDLYCDDELPNAGNFTVGYIFYYSSTKKIIISDPNDCLPQKLLALDLTTTPFRGIGQSVDYKLYNCTANAVYNLDRYSDAIDCLSGSGYTVIGVSSSTIVSDPYCTFLGNVSIPTEYGFSRGLTTYSRIHLTWDDHGCKSCIDQKARWGAILGISLSMSIALVLFCYTSIRLYLISRNDSRTSRIINSSANTTTTTENAPTSSGLDQVTIESFPVVVVGESRAVIKHDHNMCPICLSEYSPTDTLKMLPHCLHRFHADCIDVWLKTKPTCPICRTSPSQKC